MDKCPTVIQELILKYKQDFELYESQPKPCILQYCNVNQICCYDRFISERLLELLYSRVPLFEVRQCIKCLLRIPANIFVEYDTACKIFKQRCELWDVTPNNDSRQMDYWAETLPTILNTFLDDGDVGTLYHQVNSCLSRDYLYNLRITEAW